MAANAAYLGALGITTNGVLGLYMAPDGNTVQGQRERIAQGQSVLTACALLHDLVKVGAAQEEGGGPSL